MGSPASSVSRPAVVIRHAQTSDLRGLTVLEREVFGADAYSADQLRALLESDAMLWMCEAGGKVVGYAAAQVWKWPEFRDHYGVELDVADTANVGYLKSIAVAADGWRRSGIGTRLHDLRIAFLRRRGIREVLVFQMPAPGVAEFHRSLGFHPTGLRSRFRYADGARASLWHRCL